MFANIKTYMSRILSPLAGVFFLTSSWVGGDQAAAQNSTRTWSDFNGDGFADLAVGVPHEDLNSNGEAIVDAGAVVIIYGSSDRLSSEGCQLWRQNSDGIKGVANSGDEFGYALAAGDFNGDGFGDLAVSAGGADEVNVLYGSGQGLTEANNQLWQAGSPGIPQNVKDLGAALTAGDFNGDGFADLAFGNPQDNIAGAPDVGSVIILYGRNSGLSEVGSQLWHLDSPGIIGQPDSDWFGSALAAGDFDHNGFDDLAVGIPLKDVGGSENAGAVSILYGTSNGLAATANQLWHQNSEGIEGVAERIDNFGQTLATGDFDGDTFDDLAIGVPYENNFKGAVQVLYGSSNGLSASGSQKWDQDSPNVQNETDAYDMFGRSLTVGNFNGDRYDDLAIGVPLENLVNDRDDYVEDAGAVHVLYGSSNKLSAVGAQFWHLGTPGIFDFSETNDYFGDALTAGDFNGDSRDDLVIGIFGQDVWGSEAFITDAGEIYTLYGANSGVSLLGYQLWNQSSPGIKGVLEEYDRFGLVLGASTTSGGSASASSKVMADASAQQATAADATPLGYALEANYPNPFNPSTTIQFALPTESFVTLKVYNLLGAEVASLVQQKLPAGVHHVIFDAKNLPSGTYLYRLQAGEFKQISRMTLVK